MKTCTKCKQCLPFDAFYKDKSRSSGLEHRCKACSYAKRLKWGRDNPGKHNAHASYYRALRLKATPPWADLEAIQEIYSKCPEGHHVDHIIPLKGRLVTGLHVPENLQYLPIADNIRKSNHFQI